MKTELYKKEDEIIRVLEVEGNAFLIIDCIKFTMPVWVSDINGYERCDRELKAYMYGLITAKDWQTGAHSYTFKATAKMTKTDAKASIKALKSAKKAYKLSDDWQMVRTKNLPEQAKYFPYILTTFPNEYCDKALAFDARYTISANKGKEQEKVEAAKKLGVTPVSRVDTYWNLMTSSKECSDMLVIP